MKVTLAGMQLAELLSALAPTGGNLFGQIRAGETVLDLASGSGETSCYLSRHVGPEGRIIGIESNVQLLEQADIRRRLHSQSVGWDNIEFHRAQPHNLALDLAGAEDWLRRNPVGDLASWWAFEDFARRQREENPVVANEFIDVAICRGVLNYMPADRKLLLLAEIFRVLKRGGRLLLEEVVADRPIAEASGDALQIWGESITGAMDESSLREALGQVGFDRIEIVECDPRQQKTIGGMRFAQVAFKVEKQSTVRNQGNPPRDSFESLFGTLPEAGPAKNSTSCCYRSDCC